MRHMIIGASGQVGGAIYGSATLERKSEAVGTWNTKPAHGLRKLDITDRSRVFRLVRDVAPDVIYLCAALTNVDRCEQEMAESYRVNVFGTHNLIDAANRTGATLVFLSSDYVFDGADGPYTEMDAPNPLSVYGFHKLIGEHLVSTSCENYLIVRSTVVFGWEEIGKNFIIRLRQKLAQKQYVRVPSDQVGTPTYNRNLAVAILDLVKNGARGVYNVAGTTSISRYDFALQAARIFGLDPRLIVPVTTAKLEQPARRPLKGGLNVKKAQSEIATKLLSSEEGLQKMLKDEL